MESQLPKFLKDPKKYSELRLLEAIEELYLGVKMLKEGYSRNAANKLFLSWKALLSSLVTSNFDKVVGKKLREGKVEEAEWYRKVGYSAPTTGLVGISKDLEELGYNGLIALTTAMLGVHKYNGLDPDMGPFPSRREALTAIRGLALEELKLISSLELNAEQREALERVKRELGSLNPS